MTRFADLAHLNTDRIADPLAAGFKRSVGLEHIEPENLHIRGVDAIKAAAGACHGSQGGAAMRRGWMRFFSRTLGRHEDYMQAYPPLNGGRKVKKDLLAGLS